MSKGFEIASFKKAATQIEDGFSWDAGDFDNGDFSLTLLRASLDLQGVYECMVSYNSTVLHSSNVSFSVLGRSLFSYVHPIWTFKPTKKAEFWHLYPHLIHQFLLLSFLAYPTLSIPQQWVVLETESHLKCHADGFYPPPVSFSWTRDEQVIQPPYEVEGEQTVDGYYVAVGNLTFYPSGEDRNVTFGCRVSHSGTYQELDFQLNITCE